MAFVIVYVSTPVLIKFLIKNNVTVLDYHKKEKTIVSRPGGPAIIAGILASEAVLYVFVPEPGILAIMATSFLAFLVGLIDDYKKMGGWFKPIGLGAAAIPILIIGAYDSNLVFPLFGEIHIPIIYMGLIVVMISITGNTVNSIDIFNGVISVFMIIAGFTLTLSMFIVESFQSNPSYEIALASLPLGFVALAFYKYHKYPTRIFPGDSGALVFGAMYGSLAIMGHVEVIAAIAILPAIINSFLFLSSVKRIIEHSDLKTRAVVLTDDFKIKPSTDPHAQLTLVRLIVSLKPMTELQVSHILYKLMGLSSILAIITAFLMGVRL